MKCLLYSYNVINPIKKKNIDTHKTPKLKFKNPLELHKCVLQKLQTRLNPGLTFKFLQSIFVDGVKQPFDIFVTLVPFVIRIV